MNAEAGAAGAQHDTRPYPPASQGWAMVLIFLLFYVISHLDRSIFTLLGEQVRHDMALTDVQLSLLFGPAFAVAYAVGSLPVGWALDRYSRRAIVWAGVTIWSLGTMACGLARGFTGLFIARSTVGSGEAVVIPGAHSILSDMFPPERRTFPLGVYSAGSVLGMGVSLALGGLLARWIDPASTVDIPVVGALHGWQAILVLVGFPGLLAALVIFVVAEPPRRRDPSAPVKVEGYGAYFRFAGKNLRFFLNFFMAAIIMTVIITSLQAWTAIFFQRVHGWSIAQSGLWLGVIMMIGPVIGLPIHGLITDVLLRRGIRDAHMRYLACSLLISIPLLAGTYLVGSPWLALGLYCLGQAAMQANTPLLPAAMQFIVPGEMRAKAAGVMMLVTALFGAALGPPIAAFAATLLGGDDKVGLSLAVCVAVLIPFAILNCLGMMKPLRAVGQPPEATH